MYFVNPITPQYWSLTTPDYAWLLKSFNGNQRNAIVAGGKSGAKAEFLSDGRHTEYLNIELRINAVKKSTEEREVNIAGYGEYTKWD